MTFSSVVEHYRDRYLLNTNNTPISELLNIRLLATSIGRTEATIAPIRWDSTGDIISFREVTLPLEELRSLVSSTLDTATVLVFRDLLFNLDPPRDNFSQDLFDF